MTVIERYECNADYYDDEHPDDGYKGTCTIKRFYQNGYKEWVEETTISIPSHDDAIAMSIAFNELIDRIESLEGEVAQLSE